MNDRPSDETILTEWTMRVARELGIRELGIGETGIDAPAIGIEAVLGLAGRAAHAVIRPAAPLTTFLVGYAAGRAAGEGGDPHVALEEAIDAALALCRTEQRRAEQAQERAGSGEVSSSDDSAF